MDKIKEFIAKICTYLSDLTSIPFYTVALIGLGLVILFVGLITFLIIRAVIKSKKKKAQKVEVKVEDKPIVEEKAPEVKEEVVLEQPVETKKAIEQPTTEIKVEEQPATEIKVEEKKPVKKAPAKKVVEEEKQPKKKFGKWVVEFKGHGEYLSKLLASNGEIMLSSEIYTTEEGARGGIATIIRGVDNGKFVVYQDKNGNYYYKLKTANNRLLCVGEIYKSKDRCLKAVESVKRIAKESTVVDELVEGTHYIDYVPAQTDAKKGARGKWRVEKTADGNYTAKLYASNGQLMLATEEVALEKSAVNAIASVKKNSAEGNFIIDKDKFGRFYYKLRNAQKSVICIGEAYDTLESCTNAIESVRRFATNSVVEGKEE